MNISKISVLITNYCTVKCPYCFEKNTSDTTIFNLYDEFLDFLKLVDLDKEVMITLSGGELSLVPNELYRAIKEINKIKRYKDIKLKYRMTTSGIQIKNLVPLFKECLIDQLDSDVSWDGIPPKNFNHALDTIVKEDLKLTVRCAMIYDNLNILYDNVLFLLDRGIRRIELYPLDNRAYTIEELRIIEEQFYKIIELRNKTTFYFRNIDEIGHRICDSIYKCFSCMMDGDLYPCLGFSPISVEHVPQSRLGNIKDKDLQLKQNLEWGNTYCHLLNNKYRTCPVIHEPLFEVQDHILKGLKNETDCRPIFNIGMPS